MIVGVADTHSALWYLFNDGRLSATAGTFLDQAGAAGNYIIVSAISLAEIVPQVARSEVPDMPDRIVAATAVYLKVPIISRDGRIRASSLQTIW